MLRAWPSVTICVGVAVYAGGGFRGDDFRGDDFRGEILNHIPSSEFTNTGTAG